MWIAGEYISKLVMSSQSGIWFESNSNGEYGLVAKLPSNTIKALSQGCECRLWLSISSKKPSYVTYALVVYDSDEAPLIVYNFLANRSSRFLLPQSLTNNPVWFCFVDETDAMVMSSKVKIIPHNGFLDHLDLLNQIEISVPSDNNELFSCMDVFETQIYNHLFRKKCDQFNISVADCQLSDFSFNRISHFNEYINSSYFQSNDIQGNIQEIQAYQMLSYCFKNKVFHSPQVTIGKKKRELIDVLALHEKGVLLVESKCLNITEDSSAKTFRQNRHLLNHCEKALGQIEGAIKAIYRKERIEKASDTIDVSMLNNMHGIVLISDFIGTDGWNDVHNKILKLYHEDNIKTHIFSLGDLSMTLKLCSQNDSLFTYLDKRFQVVLESGCLEVMIRDPSLPFPKLHN